MLVITNGSMINKCFKLNFKMNKTVKYITLFVAIVNFMACDFSNNDLEAEYPFNGNLNDYVSAEVGVPIGDISFEKTAFTKGVKFIRSDKFNLIELPNTKLSSKEYTISFFASFEDFENNNSLVFFGNKKESWGNSGLWIYTERNKIAVFQEGQLLIKEDYDNRNEFNSTFIDSKELDVDSMYFFTITYSKNDLKIYVNGLLDSNYKNVKPFTSVNRNILLGIANDPKVKYKFQFNGVMDELKIFNKTLLEEDVMILYKSYNEQN